MEHTIPISLLQSFLTNDKHDLQPIYFPNILDSRVPFFEARARDLINQIPDISKKKVIDLGANIGYDSMLLASKTKAKITAVDYMPLCVHFIRFLANYNGLSSHVTAYAGFYQSFVDPNTPIYDIALMYHLFRIPSPGILEHWKTRARQIWIDPSASVDETSFDCRKKQQEDGLSDLLTFYKTRLPKSNVSLVEFTYSWMIRIDNDI
jgi:hypothetical protein